MKLLRAAHLSLDDHRRWFEVAGFSEVETFEERGKGWRCARGSKPGGRLGSG